MVNAVGDDDVESGGERLMCNVARDGDVKSRGERKHLRGYVLTLMCNVVGDVKSSGEL